MGQGKQQANAQAKIWWNSNAAANSRIRGYAICDLGAAHHIPVGRGYLCKPTRIGDQTPDLVCEACFDRLPYEPWQGNSESISTDVLAKLIVALLESDVRRSKKRKARLIAAALAGTTLAIGVMASVIFVFSSETSYSGNKAQSGNSRYAENDQRPTGKIPALHSLPALAEKSSTSGASAETKARVARSSRTATVRSVITGSSLWTHDGQLIRFAGIVAPFRSGSKNAASAPGGQEAYEFVKEMLEGTEVTLDFDPLLPDRDGAAYAYIVLPDGTMLNSILLENGLVKIDGNAAFSRLAEFTNIQDKARLEKKGIWHE